MDGQKFDRLNTEKSSVILGQYGEVIYSNSGYEVPDYIADGVVFGFKKRFLKEGA